MRFLAKDPDSPHRTLVYLKGCHNDTLLRALLSEQLWFCAYTEMRVSRLDTCAVEHFDREIKHSDGYDNYYAVLQSANQRKRVKEARYAGATFFTNRFFQAPGALIARIRYVGDDHVYEEIDPDDVEARDFIDFLGFNDHPLVEERRNHVRRITDLIELADFDLRGYLRKYPEELSFVTALEAALDQPLSDLLRLSG